MIDAGQLRDRIIYPTLKHLDLWSDSAENLIMGTIAQESEMGRYLKQLYGGPARGICQMEPRTHQDIWTNYLAYKHPLAVKVMGLASRRSTKIGHPNPAELEGNLFYSVAMCRVHYLRVPEALPDAEDIEGLAAYYKTHYNTPKGAATVEEFIENYHRYVIAIIEREDA